MSALRIEQSYAVGEGGAEWRLYDGDRLLSARRASQRDLVHGSGWLKIARDALRWHNYWVELASAAAPATERGLRRRAEAQFMRAVGAAFPDAELPRRTVYLGLDVAVRDAVAVVVDARLDDEPAGTFRVLLQRALESLARAGETEETG